MLAPLPDAGRDRLDKPLAIYKVIIRIMLSLPSALHDITKFVINLGLIWCGIRLRGPHLEILNNIRVQIHGDTHFAIRQRDFARL